MNGLRQDRAPAGEGPTIAVMFATFGPYHVARLTAAARTARLVAIEGSAASDEYAWERTHAAGDIRRVTLFNDAPIGRKRSHEVAAKVFAVLTACRPDVVAVPDWVSAWGLAMLAWAVGNGVPSVVMSESQEIDHTRASGREWVKRKVVGAFSAALVGGRRHVDYLAQLGMARDRIFTGYDVVDNRHLANGAGQARAAGDELRRRLGLPDRYFLASARFVANKNLARLIDAYAAYRAGAGADAWGLVLLGDGVMRGALERRIARLGLGSTILMPGFVQYDNLPDYYGLAEAFVHVSAVEPWGLVVNEAAAAGLPLIVSGVCGCAPELVEEERNGFVVDPCDVRGIAAAMQAIAGDGCDRAAMGRASIGIVARWTPEAFTTGLTRAVDVALARPRRAPGVLDRMLVTALQRI